MEQQKESIESVINRAPKGATHYSYPEYFSNEVYCKIEEGVVESVWIPLSCFTADSKFWHKDCGYWRADYSGGGDQPYLEWDSLVELPKQADKWVPTVGEIVLFKRNDSIDYAYDTPERMEVVTIVGDKVWLKNALRDMITNLDNISPLEKEKSLREELIDIMSCGGRWDYVNVDQVADRLIEAGIKLKEE